jgi:NH3-dependent NAD+ synthetase
MEDHKLDQLLEDARSSYRVPPAPAVEAIWHAVEAEAFAPQVRTHDTHRMLDWRIAGMLAAASLVIGIVGGRWSTSVAPTATMAAAATETEVSNVALPYQQTTEEVLGRTAVLLAALRTEDTKDVNAQLMNEQASRLLTNVRFLLDSPAAADPQMQALLLDLELTLAQVARMQPARGQTELTLINDAVAERDIVPRIRSAVVEMSAGGY